MEILLEEFYKNDLHIDKFHHRKVLLDNFNYQINGISQSGKTKLVKNYLLGLKKNSYLYINCSDIRIDIVALNKILAEFCTSNKITCLVLDNYIQEIHLVNVAQIIITCENYIPHKEFESIQLFPLDYEEFLAYEHKYDSSALNHFIQLGGFPAMQKIHPENRALHIQKSLLSSLDSIEFDILTICAKMMSQKFSAYTIYERLKSSRKISKDKLYRSYEGLLQKNYIHAIEKLHHQRATKKIYLCDISLRGALSTEKHFGRLFENMVFLELLKHNEVPYYDDGIDFYLAQTNEVILCMPFTDERSLFKKLEQIEAFIFGHQVSKITAVTMNKEGHLSHPISKVEMLPFDIWALGD